VTIHHHLSRVIRYALRASSRTKSAPTTPVAGTHPWAATSFAYSRIVNSENPMHANVNAELALPSESQVAQEDERPIMGHAQTGIG